MTTLTVSDRAGTRITHLAVLTVKDGDRARVAGADGVSTETATAVDAALKTLKATADPDEVVRLAGIPGADVVLASGSGLTAEPTDADAEAVRRAAGAAVRALTDVAAATFAFPAGTETLAAAVAEGALFGAYTFTAYRSGKAPQPVGKVTVVSPIGRTAGVKKAAERAAVVAEEQAWARDLVNTPPLDLYPASFADLAKKHLAPLGVKVSIMDEKQLAKADCGGLIGVGRGSARPPRLVTLSYKPAKAKTHIALVGKGITFDSGGLCIKPATGMVTMKCDMAGAAAVAAATAAIARLGLPVQVTTYLCLAENMTGADAQRPGDVVTMPNGKTVEIINTDAEGRLVMADGLSFASKQRPDLVLDVATLTGAAVLSLGPRTTAVLSNSDETRAEVLDAAAAAGEAMWPIPLLDELRAGMKSTVADVKHTGERQGGMITAALFLREFVGDDKAGNPLPWAHLDIAGPAFNEGSGAYGYTPVGATGHPVRTLVALAEARA
ncbi:leucyl aminopeptidase [Calidifontibacter sp. DB0510]|uniref:Probable cytosol aminopeptidase n=1 Tax=Metallococcus carri TaxID=1656884 RepID=A0A967B2A5_9MICO|nr:leucyl aminopeptidase [Metallococcus carri]NHN55975.1 leucyl aminopeptidase [Metallococcus carri]NOP37568.1 leucyl aminopeptidase [Calidifontibacter sp. DB2511S]